MIKYLKFIKAIPQAFSDLMNSRTTLSLAFAYLVPPKLRDLGFYPRILKTIDGIKFYYNDYITLQINIPDQYVRREYELHPAYIPRRG